MSLTLAGASGLALIATFLGSLAVLRWGLWRTAAVAIFLFWIVFLLLRAVLDVPDPLIGDLEATMTLADTMWRDAIRAFLAAPGEILIGIGALVSDSLGSTGEDLIASLSDGPLAGDPSWYYDAWAHVARVVGRTTAAIVVMFLGKGLFGGAWSVIRRVGRA